jgi:hypothetical protein
MSRAIEMTHPLPFTIIFFRTRGVATGWAGGANDDLLGVSIDGF